MDKYPVYDFLPNIVIHKTLSICGRMASWDTQDPSWVLGFYHLVGSRLVLIWWAVLGCFMRWSKRWAWVDAGPIE